MIHFQVIEPGFLTVLRTRTCHVTPTRECSDYVDQRTPPALAEAIASPDNPLTARVMVNRIWVWHFGERHRQHSRQFRKDGHAAIESGTAGLAGHRVHAKGLEH